MNTNTVMGAHTDEQLERIKSIGEKYNVNPISLLMAMIAIENAISQLPEEIIDDAALSFALATHIGRRIAHNGHRELIDEAVTAVVANINEWEAARKAGVS